MLEYFVINFLTLSNFIKIAAFSNFGVFKLSCRVKELSDVAIFCILSAGALTYNSGEDEDPNQVADDDEDIPATCSKTT